MQFYFSRFGSCSEYVGHSRGGLAFGDSWALVGRTHRPQSSPFWGLPYRILNINPKKELLWGLWVGVGNVRRPSWPTFSDRVCHIPAEVFLALYRVSVWGGVGFSVPARSRVVLVNVLGPSRCRLSRVFEGL